MDDAASEISDWELLSASSACGGDDRDDVVVVSGGGGDVHPDHFTLDLASPDDGFSGEGSWLEPEVACVEEDRREAVELLDEFDSVAQESLDLVSGLSSLQLQEGAADDDENRQLQEGAADDDENRESSVREAAAVCGAEGRQAGAVGLETEQDSSAPQCYGVLGSTLQPAHHVVGVGEALDCDATMPTDAPPHSKQSDDSSVKLEDIEVDASIETSCAEDSVTADGIHGGQAEQNQGDDAYAASECNETDGEVKDGALPLVQAPGSGEEGKQVVVWWRLPLKLLHYCAWNVKPVWSFSIAAALLGLVALGRKMYRMKHKAKGMPQIKIAFDDKRASQYANRAARLNEAFLIARRVPMLRTSSGAMLPWSMVQER